MSCVACSNHLVFEVIIRTRTGPLSIDTACSVNQWGSFHLSHEHYTFWIERPLQLFELAGLFCVKPLIQERDWIGVHYFSGLSLFVTSIIFVFRFPDTLHLYLYAVPTKQGPVYVRSRIRRPCVEKEIRKKMTEISQGKKFSL